MNGLQFRLVVSCPLKFMIAWVGLLMNKEKSSRKHAWFKIAGFSILYCTVVFHRVGLRF